MHQEANNSRGRVEDGWQHSRGMLATTTQAIPTPHTSPHLPAARLAPWIALEVLTPQLPTPNTIFTLHLPAIFTHSPTLAWSGCMLATTVCAAPTHSSHCSTIHTNSHTTHTCLERVDVGNHEARYTRGEQVLSGGCNAAHQRLQGGMGARERRQQLLENVESKGRCLHHLYVRLARVHSSSSIQLPPYQVLPSARQLT